jgi:hypothetical protein
MSVRNMLIGSAGARVPGAPTSVSATGGSGSASVSFTAPADNGGTAITQYTVTSNTGGYSATGSSSPITVSGIADGTYTFTVTATNAIGTGPASDPSNSVSITSALYTWNTGTSVTFTNLSSTGAFGPSETTINNARSSEYASAPFASSSTFFSAISGVAGIQRLRIPIDGTWRFQVRGARGGSSSGNAGGQGAGITVEGPLSRGQDILLVVGQAGGDQGGSNGGGGGGSFVYLLNGSGYDQYVMTDIIAAAGGGSGGHSGGGNGNGSGSDGGLTMLGQYGLRGDARNTSYTRPAPGYAGMWEHIASAGRNYGGGPGAGFMSRQINLGDFPGSGSITYFAATSGAVFNSGSSISSSVTDGNNFSGSAFPGNSGRTGNYSGYSDYGTGVSGYSGPWVGGRADNSASSGDGGFGGGGGATTNCGGSGAGGGFSGGQGTGCYSVSGGGGTYGRLSSDGFTGWSLVTSAFNHGDTHGSIIVTRIA